MTETPDFLRIPPDELRVILLIAVALKDCPTEVERSTLRSRLFEDLKSRGHRAWDALDHLAVLIICQSVLGPHWVPPWEPPARF